MPLTFLSHQAVVLPLKLAAPRWTSGTALVLGSMAPDVVYYVRGLPAGGAASHSWLGQLTICLPVTLVLFWVVTRIVAAPLAANLPSGGGLRLEEYRLLRAQPPTLRHWAVVAISALIGSASHLVLDRSSGGWSAEEYPQSFAALATDFLPPGRAWWVVQLVLWIVLALPTLLMLRFIARRGLLARWARERGFIPAGSLTAARRPLLFWSPVIITAIAAIAWGAAFPRKDYHLHEASTWVQIGLRTMSCIFLAIVAMSIWWRLREQRSHPVPEQVE
jgi:hypothetical protein